jgi:protein-S-isoprenylcysteine O-methyltransferase Ste14
MLKSIRCYVGYHRILLSIIVGVCLYVFAMPTAWTIMAGLPIILLGEAIRIWSSGYITKNKALVQDGPYAIVRHPLYLGNFIIGLGFAVMTGKTGLIILYSLAFGMIYFATIAEEEESLEKLFGGEFSEYVNQVPSIIPRLGVRKKSRTGFRWERVIGHREYKTWMAIGIFLVLMVFKSYYVL